MKKSANHYLFSLVLVGALLFLVFIISADRIPLVKHSKYPETLEQSEASPEPLSHIHEGFIVDTGFSTNLPIVIIDTANIEPPISMATNATGNGLASLQGVEPTVAGKLAVIDHDGMNSLSDTPVQTSSILIKRAGNAAMFYEKPQYLINLVTADGEAQSLSILEMGEESEWLLNGSMADKSMLRNYLAYSLSAEIMPFIPANVYCEVIFKKGMSYSYQGVYLMGESVKQGVNRVNIEESNPEKGNFAYLVKRDQINDQEMVLATAETEESASRFSLIYPGAAEASLATQDYVAADISRIEKILYSDDYFKFSSYPDYIDVDSFVDYFLINEYFGNYSAGEYSTYLYKEAGGKLKIGPVWDFERAIDNYQREGFNPEFTALQLKPWFDRLMTDKSFVKKLEARYAKLYKGVLAEEHVISQIDGITSYLGDAQQREWYRWDHIYRNSKQYQLEPVIDRDGEILYRESTTYKQELYRIKTVLRQHGQAMGQRLALLEKSAKWDTGMSRSLSVLLPGIVLSAVIIGFYFKKR